MGTLVRLLKSLMLVAAIISSVVTSVYADYIEDPYFTYFSGGALFDLVNIDQTISVVPVPNTIVNGGNTQTASMSLDGLNGFLGFGAGKTNTDLGIGGSINAYYSALNLYEGDNFLHANTWGFFANLDFRTLASATHNADSNIGVSISAGIGLINFINIDGSYSLSLSASSQNIADIFYTAENTFALAGQVKGGVDVLIGDSIVATMAIGAICTFADTELNTLKATPSYKPAQPVNGGPEIKAEGTLISLPALAILMGEIRLSKFFNSAI